MSPNKRKSSLVSHGVRSSLFSLREKPLSLWSFVALVFFTVSGGPFGSEPAMAAGGPFWTLVGFSLFPFVWSVPEALITAELGSRFPSNCGVINWCTGAYGPLIGYLEGWLTLINSFCNCAVFVRLFASYASWLCGINSTVVVIVFSVANTYINYRGLEFVGRLGIWMMCIIALP